MCLYLGMKDTFWPPIWATNVVEPSGDEWKHLRACSCPACWNYDVTGLQASKLHGSCCRATHNLGVLLEENTRLGQHVPGRTYAENYAARIDSSIYRPVIDELLALLEDGWPCGPANESANRRRTRRRSSSRSCHMPGNEGVGSHLASAAGNFTYSHGLRRCSASPTSARPGWEAAGTRVVPPRTHRSPRRRTGALPATTRGRTVWTCGRCGG